MNTEEILASRHLYYEILGVEGDATNAGMKKAYHHLVLKLHPDKSAAEAEAFKAIDEAYKTLLEPKLRKRYDLFADP